MEGDGMNGDFGVFDHTELVAEFGDDESAEAHKRALEQDPIYVPVYEHGMFVAEVPEEYHAYKRLLDGLIKSRDADRALDAAKAVLDLEMNDAAS